MTLAIRTRSIIHNERAMREGERKRGREREKEEEREKNMKREREKRKRERERSRKKMAVVNLFLCFVVSSLCQKQCLSHYKQFGTN